MPCRKKVHRKQGITRLQVHKDIENAQYDENKYLLTEKYLLLGYRGVLWLLKFATGIHGLHVLAGVILLLVMAVLVSRGEIHESDLSNLRIQDCTGISLILSGSISFRSFI